MSETIAPDRVEAVLISGPDRGKIIELPVSSENSLTQGEISMLNAALDQVIASLDRLEHQIEESTRAFEMRERY